MVGNGSSLSAFNEAFRWTSGGGMAGLGDFLGGNTFSTALGVSADGSIIAGYGVSASGAEAFRWTSGGGLVGLGNLPGEISATPRGPSRRTARSSWGELPQRQGIRLFAGPARRDGWSGRLAGRRLF